MAEVKKLVSFLDTLGTIPNLKISITNEWAIEISTSMGLEDLDWIGTQGYWRSWLRHERRHGWHHRQT
jgi:hypothetical protein